MPTKAGYWILVILIAGAVLIALALFTARKGEADAGSRAPVSSLNRVSARPEAHPGTAARQAVSSSASVSNARPGAVGGRVPGKGDSRVPGASSKEMAQVEAARERLDEEDTAGALKLIRGVMKSRDPEIRSEAASMLGWIGVRALGELSEMLSDEEDEVARKAFDEWQCALEEIEDDAVKANLLTVGMMAMNDQERMEECVMAFTQLPDDLAVRGLVRMIGSNNPIASEVAREQYGFVTGDEYISPDEAEKWIRENMDQE